MKCKISIKELYRPLHRESFQPEPRRGYIANRVSLRVQKSAQSMSNREKKPTKILPGLIIQMWKLNNEEELKPKPSSLTPELKKRPYSSVFINKSSFSGKGLGALEGVRMKHNSVSIDTCDNQSRLKKRRTLKAVLPKVEHLKGWSY